MRGDDLVWRRAQRTGPSLRESRDPAPPVAPHHAVDLVQPLRYLRQHASADTGAVAPPANVAPGIEQAVGPPLGADPGGPVPTSHGTGDEPTASATCGAA